MGRRSDKNQKQPVIRGSSNGRTIGKLPESFILNNMRQQIKELLDQGLSYREISEKLSCSKATISYHAKRLGKQSFVKKTYDWAAIQTFYNEGHSYRECKEKFGFHSCAWHNAVKAGKLVVNNKPKELHEIKKRHNVKKRVIKKGLLTNECQACGLKPEWNGKVLVLQIDHINGVNNDHRLENLRLLCPNCHSQTDTFCHKNRKQKIYSVVD